MKHSQHIRQARGFTLLEMLVTLVILGLASALLFQSIFTLAQFDQRLNDWRGANAEYVLQRFWLQQSLATVVPARMAMEQQFQGDAQGFSAWVVNPPWPQVNGPLWVDIRLQQNGQTWNLIATSPGLPDWSLAEQLHSGEFLYLNENDSGWQWANNWAPRQVSNDFTLDAQQYSLSVPRAIRFQSDSLWLDMTVLVTATRNPQLSQLDFVGLEE